MIIEGAGREPEKGTPKADAAGLSRSEGRPVIDNAVPTESKGRNIWLSMASTILWVWTVLIVVSQAFLVVGIVSMHTVDVLTLMFCSGLIVMGIASGVGAVGIRRSKRPYNFVALFSTLAWISALCFLHVRVSVVGVLLNVAVLILVLVQWRRFA